MEYHRRAARPTPEKKWNYSPIDWKDNDDGSMVSKSTSPFGVYVGVPAKRIKKRGS